MRRPSGAIMSESRLQSVVEHRVFRGAVVALISLNALIVALETYPEVVHRAGHALDILDRAIVGVFIVEIALRLLAARPRLAFFASGWNLFDVAVVAGGLLPGSEYLSVLRLLRVVRILRVFSVVPDLQRLVVALLRSLPSLGHIILLLSILLFSYGVAGTFIFRDVDPAHFGSLHRSVLTLFGVITLETWVDIMDHVQETHAFAWVYFVTFILLGTFVSMNLFVGVIVNAIQAPEQERDAAADAVTHERLRAIEEKLDALLRARGTPT